MRVLSKHISSGRSNSTEENMERPITMKTKKSMTGFYPISDDGQISER
jgi:hypothetical protein